MFRKPIVEQKIKRKDEDENAINSVLLNQGSKMKMGKYEILSPMRWKGPFNMYSVVERIKKKEYLMCI
jgi:hypothetical protein